MTRSDDRDDRVDEAIAEYMAACEAGSPPDRAAFLARHPDLAESLQAFLADHDHIRQATAPAASPDDTKTLPPGGAAAPAAASPLLGSIKYFGDYELLDEIARGGMGVVYRARQVSLNRVVAVKLILAGEFAGGNDVRRFRAEAEAAANLDHPYILPIYEVGEHAGQQYFSMKLVSGGSLSQHLAQSPRPAIRGLVEVMGKVARAVHYAHQSGILHRDLKPGNILLDADGTPYVTDFGLAKKVDAPSELTQSGALVGTPSYMPPEQARGEKRVTTAADVYSLGAILYEMLTGRPPFRSATVLDTVLQVIDREPDPPRAVNLAADRDLSVIALKCLNKDTVRRYPSAAALADDLDRWANGEPILARPVGRLERGWRWCRRNPVVAALSAAVGLLLLGTLAGAVFAAVYFNRLAGNERAARESAEEMEKAATKSLERTEESLAEGILRPLGSGGRWSALLGLERDALEDLASLPRERDRVRMLFFDRGLEEKKVWQLNVRLEEALVAGVGLRRDLRERVLKKVEERFSDEQAGEEARIALLRLTVRLEATDRQPPRVLARRYVDLLGARTDSFLDLMSPTFAEQAAKLPPAEAVALARRLVELAGKSTDVKQLSALAAVFVALAGKLPEAEASRDASALASRFVELAGKSIIAPEQLRALAAVFSEMPGKLSAGQASALATRLVKLAGKSTEPIQLIGLAAVFAALVGRVPEAETSQYAFGLASPMVELLGKSTDAYWLRQLAAAFVPLAEKVSAGQASALASRIVELAGKSTNSDQQSVLAAAFAALAGKLQAAEASRYASTLASRIVELTGKCTDFVQMSALADAIAALAEKLSAEHASALAGRIVELAGKCTTPLSSAVETHTSLVGALGALTGKVPAGQASALATRIVELAGKSTEPYQLSALTASFAVLVEKLPAGQTSALASRIVELAGKSADLQELDALAAALAALSRELPAAEASRIASALASRLGELAGKSNNPYGLSFLPAAFARLAEKLSVEHTSALASRMVELAGKSTNPDELRALAAAFAALARKLPAAEASRHASALATRIIDRAGESTTPFPNGVRNNWPAGALGVLADWLPEEVVVRCASAILPRLVIDPYSRESAEVVVAWQDVAQEEKQAFQWLAAHLPAQQQVDLLKYPGYVGEGRQVLIHHLAKQHGYPGSDLWGLIAHLERHHPELDLASPFDRKHLDLSSRAR
jgi:uncharacterized protein (DUF2267 family)/predicted Ser/Thr protein kinase